MHLTQSLLESQLIKEEQRAINQGNYNPHLTENKNELKNQLEPRQQQNLYYDNNPQKINAKLYKVNVQNNMNQNNNNQIPNNNYYQQNNNQYNRNSNYQEQNNNQYNMNQHHEYNNNNQQVDQQYDYYQNQLNQINQNQFSQQQQQIQQQFNYYNQDIQYQNDQGQYQQYSNQSNQNQQFNLNQFNNQFSGYQQDQNYQKIDNNLNGIMINQQQPNNQQQYVQQSNQIYQQNNHQQQFKSEQQNFFQQQNNQFNEQQYPKQNQFRNLSKLTKARSQSRDNQSLKQNNLAISKSEIKNSNIENNTEQQNVSIKEDKQKILNAHFIPNQSVINEEKENLYDTVQIPRQDKLFPIRDTILDNEAIEKIYNIVLTEETLQKMKELQKQINNKKDQIQEFKLEVVKKSLLELAYEFIQKSFQFSYQNSFKLFDYDKIILNYSLPISISQKFKQILEQINNNMIQELINKKQDQKLLREKQGEDLKIFNIQFNENKIHVNFIKFLKYSYESSPLETISLRMESITELTFQQILNNPSKLNQDYNNILKQQVQEIVQKLSTQLLFEIENKTNDSIKKSLLETQSEYASTKLSLNKMLDQFIAAFKNKSEKQILKNLILYKKISIAQKNLNNILQRSQFILNQLIEPALFKDKNQNQQSSENINESISKCFEILTLQEALRTIENLFEFDNMVIDLLNCKFDQGSIKQFYRGEQEQNFLQTILNIEEYLKIDNKYQIKNTMDKFLNKKNLQELLKNIIAICIKRNYLQSFNSRQTIFYFEYIVSCMWQNLQSKQDSLKQQKSKIFEKIEQKQYLQSSSSICYFDQEFVQTFPYDMKENTIYLQMSTDLKFQEIKFKLKNKNEVQYFNIQLNGLSEQQIKNSNLENQMKIYLSERRDLLNLFFFQDKSHKSGLIAMYLYEKQNFFMQPEEKMKLIQRIKNYFSSKDEQKQSKNILSLDFNSYIQRIEYIYEISQKMNGYIRQKEHDTQRQYMKIYYNEQEFANLIVKNNLSTLNKNTIYVLQDNFGIPEKILYQIDKQSFEMISFGSTTPDMDKKIEKAKIKYFEIQFQSDFEKITLFIELFKGISQPDKGKIFIYECLINVVHKFENSILCLFDKQFMDLFQQILSSQYQVQIQSSQYQVDINQNIKLSQLTNKRKEQKQQEECDFETTKEDINSENVIKGVEKYLSNQKGISGVNKFMQQNNITHSQKNNPSINKNNDKYLNKQENTTTSIQNQGKSENWQNELDENKNEIQIMKGDKNQHQYNIEKYQFQSQQQNNKQKYFETIKINDSEIQINKNSFKDIYDKKKSFEMDHFKLFGLISEFKINSMNDNYINVSVLKKKSNQLLYILDPKELNFIFQRDSQFYHFSKKKDISYPKLKEFKVKYIFVQENHQPQYLDSSQNYTLNVLELILWVKYNSSEIDFNSKQDVYKKNLDIDIFIGYQKYLWINIELFSRNQNFQKYNKIKLCEQTLKSYNDFKVDMNQHDEIIFTSIYLEEIKPKFLKAVCIQRINTQQQEIVILHQEQSQLFQQTRMKVKNLEERTILKCNSNKVLEQICLVSLPRFIRDQEKNNLSLIALVNQYLKMLKEDYCLSLYLA